MAAIDTTSLAKKIRTAYAVSRIRTQSYAGGNVSARLMKFRVGGYNCQIDLHDNGRRCIIVGPIVTDVPKQGWISGDWVAFGGNPKSCPELGSSYLDELDTGVGVRCYRHSMIPDDVTTRLLSRFAQVIRLDSFAMKDSELLVVTPEYVVLNLRDRDEHDVLGSIGRLLQLADCLDLEKGENRS